MQLGRLGCHVQSLLVHIIAWVLQELPYIGKDIVSVGASAHTIRTAVCRSIVTKVQHGMDATKYLKATHLIQGSPEAISGLLKEIQRPDCLCGQEALHTT